MPHKYHNYALKLLLGSFVVALLALAPSLQASRSVKLAWDSTSAPDVAGYNLFYGISSGNYTQSVNVGNSTSATLSGLTEGATYFVVVTAYNAATLQSLPSNEVSFVVPNNVPPTVSLDTPRAGASVSGLTPILLGATAMDSDGTIAKVEFYEGSNKIGEATASPFAAVWNNAPSGDYLLTALAYDDSGAAVRSAGVSITVLGSSPAPSPSPSATPTNKIHVFAMTTSVNAGSRARFKISTSTADPAQPTVVNYSLGGTAVGGVDYTQSGGLGQIVIPAGLRGASLTLDTVPTPGTGKRKTATVTIMPGANYRVGAKGATITIVNKGG